MLTGRPEAKGNDTNLGTQTILLPFFSAFVKCPPLGSNMNPLQILNAQHDGYLSKNDIVAVFANTTVGSIFGT